MNESKSRAELLQENEGIRKRLAVSGWPFVAAPGEGNALPVVPSDVSKLLAELEENNEQLAKTRA